jgi:hypothetical protein
VTKGLEWSVPTEEKDQDMCSQTSILKLLKRSGTKLVFYWNLLSQPFDYLILALIK